MTELVITRGLPASGKTTFARLWVERDRAKRARVNRDDLRRMVDDGVFIAGTTEQRIQAVRNSVIAGLLNRGVSVVCDDTNLDNRTCRDLHDIAKRAKAEFRIEDFTNTSLELCLTRNEAREDKAPIPQSVIEDMWQRYIRGKNTPLAYNPTDHSIKGSLALYEPDESLPEAFLCDIDGTVALKGARDPFDETRVHEDRPNLPVIAVIRAMSAAGSAIVFLSGRTDACRTATYEWLLEHVRVPFQGLYMRPSGDMRKDAIVKRELFDRHIRDSYDVACVLDDRDQVVEMWRALGLTCLQVAAGNF